MLITDNILKLEDIVAEFISVDETLEDLSLIKFEFINDCHWNSLDMTLYIFGAGDPESEYPVFEARIDPEFFLQENTKSRVISCKKLAAIFAEDLINEISKRNIPVVCNKSDSTETCIDLVNPGERVLQPMVR
ncbi:MAG: hypothetical protein RBR53_11930 [Desulforegulaceae bacterium]|nr:hypothetical protein [Desulforegulaceae bacterium]